MGIVKYSIDTSAILHAWIRAYPPDVFVGVWELIDELIDQGVLIATEEVRVELERKHDAPYHWARLRDDMFVPVDRRIQEAVHRLLGSYKRLVDTRKNRSGADPFVIALAQIEGCTVVTNEAPTGKLEKPNIPDVCAALGLRCISILEMIVEQGRVFGTRGRRIPGKGS